MSGYLLDTNVPSELTRPTPDFRVRDWVKAQDNFYISAVTLGELRKGLCLLVPGRRRTDLEEWYEGSFLPTMAAKILPVTQAVAERWGRMSAERQRAGVPLALADGLIAATAAEHRLILATRNTRDFDGLGLHLLNPWNESP